MRAHINLENSSRSIHLLVPEKTPLFLGWLKKIIRLGLALFLLQASIYYTHEYLFDAAMEQRHLLYNELSRVENRLDQFNQQLESSYQHEGLYHMKFGLAPPNNNLRTMGIGGSVSPDSLLLRITNPAKELSIATREHIEQLTYKMDRSQNSYLALKSYMEQKYQNWEHIPSISPTSGRFSSPFGIRTHPVTGEVGKMHYGIDISNSQWTPIYAAASGVVELVKFSDFFGNYVAVNHGNGYVTKYGHMVKFIVKEGQLVQRYQVLGYMGRTGRTTGIHLHYEVWHNDNAVNPYYYIMPHDYSVE